jgi:hypothetical protein
MYDIYRQSAKLLTLSHLEFRKEVSDRLVGKVPNKMAWKIERRSLTDVEGHLNGNLNQIQAHDEG